MLYKPTCRMSIGLNWRSPMKVSQKGDGRLGEIKDRLRIKLYWPQMLTLGIAYKYTQNSTVSLDLKWSDWSYFDRSKLIYKQMSHLNTPLTRHTRDGFRIKAGVEHRFGKGLSLGCGYIYNPYCISSKYISPALMDFTYHAFFMGIGKKFKKFSIDTSFCYTIFESREVSTSSVGYAGKYSGYGIYPSLTISYRY